MSVFSPPVPGFQPLGIPLVAPAYGPGPYRYQGTRALLFVGKADPDRIRRSLPSPLEPLDDGLVVWSLMDSPEVSGMGAHRCACPAIPCRYGDTYGSFIPFLITNTEASLLCYREVTGWAAVLGDIHFGPEEGCAEVRGSITRNGVTIAKATAMPGDEIVREAPKLPTILYKEIPSIDTETCDVSRLIITTSRLENVALRPGTGTMEFPQSDEPFSYLAPTEIIGTYYGTWDDLYPETADILHQY